MAKYKLSDWAADVKMRDGKCMHCGVFEDLHAHHIKPKSLFPELKLVLGNGITLCYRCHKKEHERTRLIRIRANLPQRRTLQKRIEQLEIEAKKLRENLSAANALNDRLNDRLDRLSAIRSESKLVVKLNPGWTIRAN